MKPSLLLEMTKFTPKSNSAAPQYVYNTNGRTIYMSEPFERIPSPFAVEDRHLDVENTQKRVRLVFLGSCHGFSAYKSRSMTLKLDRGLLSRDLTGIPLD